MRIVTLNTWKNEGAYVRRLDLMVLGLAALAPDVVCLQECFAGDGRDTAAHLASALGLSRHARPVRSKPRPHEGAMVASTSGLAMLSRLPAVAEGACALASDPADGERIAQRLDLAVGGRRLRILNLHLTHLPGPDAARLRTRQLADALCWAGEDLAAGLVVAGDLNAGAEDPALAALKARVGFEAATFLGSGGDRDGPAIDHLVLQEPGGWRVASRFRALDEADAEGGLPSDHAAVVVDLAAA
ncbi:MAG: endonuclease/exonuclease/phosphatase family protein [Caulobacteraceae bacterium]|nr:endonuclease/exonuclease/phosphatase family protein [Caulobacteraceae bacterium]